MPSLRELGWSATIWLVRRPFDTTAYRVRSVSRNNTRALLGLSFPFYGQECGGIAWDAGLVDGFRPSLLLESGGQRTIHRIPTAMELARMTPEQISLTTTE